MDVTVVVRDETTSGRVFGELALSLEAERTTVRLIIEARVHAEVRSHNTGEVLGEFKGLIEPGPFEQALNGGRRPRLIDGDAQARVALTAFERGQVLLLVDDRQRTDLDEDVVLRSGSTVTFLKLVPLVGG